MEEQKTTATKTKKKADYVAEYEEKIKNIQAEVEDYKDRWMRTQADFDNYRKRNADAVSQARTAGAGDVLDKVLEVQDNLERALTAIVDENDKKGVELISRQLKEVLKGCGVEEIETQDAEFNPEFHNAVMSEEVEGVEEGKILEVFLKGYTYKGKILRHSVVKVSK